MEGSSRCEKLKSGRGKREAAPLPLCLTQRTGEGVDCNGWERKKHIKRGDVLLRVSFSYLLRPLGSSANKTSPRIVHPVLFCWTGTTIDCIINTGQSYHDFARWFMANCFEAFSLAFWPLQAWFLLSKKLQYLDNRMELGRIGTGTSWNWLDLMKNQQRHLGKDLSNKS